VKYQSPSTYTYNLKVIAKLKGFGIGQKDKMTDRTKTICPPIFDLQGIKTVHFIHIYQTYNFSIYLSAVLSSNDNEKYLFNLTSLPCSRGKKSERVRNFTAGNLLSPVSGAGLGAGGGEVTGRGIRDCADVWGLLSLPPTKHKQNLSRCLLSLMPKKHE
jgi:hypothetical protein